MEGPLIFLKDLERLVQAQVQHVTNVAMQARPEGSPIWDQLLDRYGLGEARVQNRKKRAEELGLCQGALPEEYRSAVAAIGRLARPALIHIEKQYRAQIERNPQLREVVQRLRRRINSMCALSIVGSERLTRPRTNPADQEVIAESA